MTKIQDVATASGEAKWHYFLDKNAPPCPLGCKVQLLNEGRVGIQGIHTEDDGCIAWAPMIKRDKELEKELGLL